MTTRGKFDVITADPIHPWFREAGYLYSTEYFKLASEHLRPGGMVCQWLPIYELTPENVKSVVKTFQEHLPYTMLWLTHNDAEIVESNAPIVIDETDLARRIAEPVIAEDLHRVMMGSATDFLSYFVMGTGGMKEFSRGAIVNTDDNLYLEFSAPYSIRNSTVMGENVTAILQNRESILPYLLPARGEAARAEQVKTWAANMAAAETVGPAQALFLAGMQEMPEFKKHMTELDTKYPLFAPGRFLKNEYLAQAAPKSELFEKMAFVLFNERGRQVRIEISVVLVPISKERASVVFVDNDAKVIYAQRYLSGPGLDEQIHRFVEGVMSDMESAYREEARRALAKGKAFPSQVPTLQRIKQRIDNQVKEPSTLQNKAD